MILIILVSFIAEYERKFSLAIRHFSTDFGFVMNRFLLLLLSWFVYFAFSCV